MGVGRKAVWWNVRIPRSKDGELSRRQLPGEESGSWFKGAGWLLDGEEAGLVTSDLEDRQINNDRGTPVRFKQGFELTGEGQKKKKRKEKHPEGRSHRAESIQESPQTDGRGEGSVRGGRRQRQARTRKNPNPRMETKRE